MKTLEKWMKGSNDTNAAYRSVAIGYFGGNEFKANAFVHVDDSDSQMLYCETEDSSGSITEALENLDNALSSEAGALLAAEREDGEDEGDA